MKAVAPPLLRPNYKRQVFFKMSLILDDIKEKDSTEKVRRDKNCLHV